MSTRIDISKDILVKQYVGCRQSSTEIATDLGVHPTTVLRKLRQYGIHARTDSELRETKSGWIGAYRDPRWLKTQYIDNCRSSIDIATDCGVYPKTIRDWLRKFGIPIRTSWEASVGKHLSPAVKAKISASGRGKTRSSVTRARISAATRGENNPMYGTVPAVETRAKISKSLMGNTRALGHHPRPETRVKLSIARRGERNSQWRGGISNKRYCYKFNESFRELIRGRFHRRCYTCQKLESANVTKDGVHRKLSVHHCDFNKNSICNGKDWAFVPLCMKCHRESNNHRHDWFNKLIYYWLNDHLDFNLNVICNDL